MSNVESDGFAILVVPFDDVSRLTGISARTVRRDSVRSLGKLSKDKRLEQFFALAQYIQRYGYGPRFRCGSIECRPEKWGFLQE